MTTMDRPIQRVQRRRHQRHLVKPQRLTDLEPKQQAKVLFYAGLRVIAAWAVLAAVYLLPSEQSFGNAPIWLRMIVAASMFITVFVLFVRGIYHSRFPEIRALEAVSVIVPYYLQLFAILYIAVSERDPGAFNVVGNLTRVDSFYFTTSVFTTVGFGDIAAVSAGARALVTMQMLLNLVMIGVALRLIFDAARRGLSRKGKKGLAAAMGINDNGEADDESDDEPMPGDGWSPAPGPHL